MTCHGFIHAINEINTGNVDGANQPDGDYDNSDWEDEDFFIGEIILPGPVPIIAVGPTHNTKDYASICTDSPDEDMCAIC